MINVSSLLPGTVLRRAIRRGYCVNACVHALSSSDIFSNLIVTVTEKIG